MEGLNFRIRSLSWLSCALLLLVLVLVNVVFARTNARMDLTEEKLYTLSPGSRAILSGLEDPVLLAVFWHNVPLRFEGAKRYVAALLEEMENAADGKIQVRWVDMDEPEGEAEAEELGLEKFIFQAGHGNEVRKSEGYMSLAIEMGDERPAILNALSSIEDQLEYHIVSTIYSRSRLEAPVIGVVTPKPYNPFGPPQPGRFSGLEAYMGQAFGVAARTYLTLDEPLPEDVDVLVVVSPRDLKPEQIYHFEQFLLRGGRGILLLDPVDLENVLGQGAGQAEPHTSGMEDWLQHLGVTVEKGVVGDFGSDCLFPRGQEAVRYPFWPKLLPANMDNSNPVMRNLPATPMYWPAAVMVDAALQTVEGRTAVTLAATTEQGYRRPDIKGLRSTSESGSGKLLERVPLLVLLEGPLKSFWLGKPVPGQEVPTPEGDGEGADGQAPAGDAPGEGSDDADPAGAEGPAKAEGSPDGDAPAGSPDGEEPAEGEPTDKKEPTEKPAEKPADKPTEKPADKPAEKPTEKPADKPADKSDEGDGDGEADASEEEDAGPARLEQGSVRLIIGGDAEFVADQFGPRSPLAAQINGTGGFNFAINAADWFGGSEELLALRARSTNPRNLEKVEDDDRKWLEYLNIGLVPLLVLLVGLTVFYVRRS